jgi:asparagine synthase (glutamine-hydrolysing)
MPGIVGAVSFSARRVDDLPFDRVFAQLRHQPKMRAARVDAPGGHAVLGVVDLGVLTGSGSASRAADGSLVVVHGDVTCPEPTAELASELLERYRQDPSSLARLEGSFAVAIWDTPHARLVLVNDRFGLRNVYYTRVADVVCFAPLVGALVTFGIRAPEIDLAAVTDFLAFEHPLGEETLLRGVHALPPATIASFDASGVRLERYWTPRYRATPTRGLDDCVDELGDRLGTAVRRSVSRLPQAGIPVSGGLDSRTILAVARPALRPETPCFTYGVPGCDDLRLASTLVRRVGAVHHTFELHPGFIAERAPELVRLTDGMHLGLNVHATILQACAQWCGVIVLGNGGDCLLDRLWWWNDDAASEDAFVDRMHARLNGVLSAAQADRLLAPALGAEFRGGPRERLRRRLALYPGDTAADAADAFNVGERHWRWVLQGVPAQATHVEFREPFYDYAVADFALTVPVRWRSGRQLHVELVRRRAPDLARVPRQGGGPLTSAAVVTRARKRITRACRVVSSVWQRMGGAVPAGQRLCGFADYDFELRGPSRALLEQLVLSERSYDRGWFRPDELRALVHDHLTCRRNSGRLLGVIATLELWLRMVVDAH